MPVSTGYVYDDRYLLHDPGAYNPERPARLEAIQQRLYQTRLIEQLLRLKPYEAPMEWLKKVHEITYIRRFQTACIRREPIFMTADCGICPASYDVARLAVGGVMAAVDAVMEGVVKNAFAAVRPPGHHAERAAALGFCFFNNVGLGAVYLLEHFGLERVAIVDWDAHHGNGTQHLFEADPRVFYLSLHEDPQHLFPGTGFADEYGTGPGQGFTLNLPLPTGSGDDEYLKGLTEAGLPALRKFAPQFLFISGGFDAHRFDRMSLQKLTRQGYGEMGRLLLQLARETAEGRVVTVLEGGYNLTALANCVEQHVRLLLGQSA
jgi:acetoin utilization deacetylase AcuC-like enzyme